MDKRYAHGGCDMGQMMGAEPKAVVHIKLSWETPLAKRLSQSVTVIINMF